jgi:hypothetical protein
MFGPAWDTVTPLELTSSSCNIKRFRSLAERIRKKKKEGSVSKHEKAGE